MVYGTRAEAWVEARLEHVLFGARQRGLRVLELKVSRREYIELCRLRVVPKGSLVLFCDVPLRVVSE